jgi:hypothetical protein
MGKERGKIIEEVTMSVSKLVRKKRSPMANAMDPSPL